MQEIAPNLDLKKKTILKPDGAQSVSWLDLLPVSETSLLIPKVEKLCV